MSNTAPPAPAAPAAPLSPPAVPATKTHREVHRALEKSNPWMAAQYRLAHLYDYDQPAGA